jgi:hypothetical protein
VLIQRLHFCSLHHRLMVKRPKLILILPVNINLFPKSKLPLVLRPRALLLVQLPRATAHNQRLQLSCLQYESYLFLTSHRIYILSRRKFDAVLIYFFQSTIVQPHLTKVGSSDWIEHTSATGRR